VNLVVSVGSSPPLRFNHQARRELSSQESSGIVLESLEDNDTLTAITVGHALSTSTVSVHWNSAASAEFGALYLPESNHLFVAAGQVSGVIDLTKASVVSIEYPFLFWSFERVSSFVAQYGELECLLYDSRGIVLDRAQVDPPYEVSRSPERLEFKSIVAGLTTLEFPPRS
jgi:hypothetical protein